MARPWDLTFESIFVVLSDNFLYFIHKILNLCDSHKVDHYIFLMLLINSECQIIYKIHTKLLISNLLFISDIQSQNKRQFHKLLEFSLDRHVFNIAIKVSSLTILHFIIDYNTKRPF